MNLQDVKKVYFLGIGGIGMSALARYFNLKRCEVHGYDLVCTSLTKKLEAEGMLIHYEDDVTLIPQKIDLVVFTPAIPDDHKELEFLRKSDIPLMKRAEVLGMISSDYKSIAVAGTHGKTTTSAILTHLLEEVQGGITAFLGGILAKQKTNFLFGNSEYVVLEADEYDRSFLQLQPYILIIISMDADHLDIYGTVEDMREAYRQLTRQIQKGGQLILGPGVIGHMSEEWKKELKEKSITVIVSQRDFSYEEVEIDDDRDYKFLFVDSDGSQLSIDKYLLPGLHNISNATLALQACKQIGLDLDLAAASLEKLRGVNRRFEKVYAGKRTLIDDYAHHPEELDNVIVTLKSLYSDKIVLAIFQPHLFTRTRDFYKGFARGLEQLDKVILLPIYPAREKPIPGVKTELIYNLMKSDKKYLSTESELLDTIEFVGDFDVVITIGAADLDKHHFKIIEYLKSFE